jgi:hypothetical protein
MSCEQSTRGGPLLDGLSHHIRLGRTQTGNMPLMPGAAGRKTKGFKPALGGRESPTNGSKQMAPFVPGKPCSKPMRRENRYLGR